MVLRAYHYRLHIHRKLLWLTDCATSMHQPQFRLISTYDADSAQPLFTIRISHYVHYCSIWRHTAPTRCCRRRVCSTGSSYGRRASYARVPNRSFWPVYMITSCTDCIQNTTTNSTIYCLIQWGVKRWNSSSSGWRISPNMHVKVHWTTPACADSLLLEWRRSLRIQGCICRTSNSCAEQSMNTI